MGDVMAALPENDPAWDYLLRNEGGYVDHPLDKGGPTKFGITIETARRHGYMGPMKDLDLKTAKDIYRKEYWKFEGIKSKRVAVKMFDMAVQFGPQRMIRWVQKELADTPDGFDKPLKPDGIIGPKTLEIINMVPEEAMLSILGQLCENKYRAIVEKDPTQNVFLTGWLFRAWRFPPA
jgi:lysozyme family protein